MSVLSPVQSPGSTFIVGVLSPVSRTFLFAVRCFCWRGSELHRYFGVKWQELVPEKIMRQLIFMCILLFAVPGFAQTAQATLDELTTADSRDAAAWLRLAAEASAADETEIAALARKRAESIQRSRNPCLYDERFREFDFWTGKWQVHLENGTFAGTNSIQPAEKGCVLIEQWRSASGGSGRSINYFDDAAGEWVQIWNDAGGSQIDIRGGLTDEGMLLEGQIHYVGNGSTFPFRGLWTPMPDGRVRQYFEQSNDGGESWTTWFEGFYSREAEDAKNR